MRHTDFYSLHKKLDEQAREELKAAVRAHGGEYIFIHVENDKDRLEERDDAPIVSAATQYMSGYEDFYITRVKLEDNGSLSIFGYIKEGLLDEYEIESVAHGHIEYIIDEIPPVTGVEDVSL